MFDYSQRPAGRDYLDGYKNIKWETVRIKSAKETNKKQSQAYVERGQGTRKEAD